MCRTDPRRATAALVLAFTAAVLAFFFWPRIDLQVSALFYRPQTGFWLAQVAWIETIRSVIWDLTIVSFVVALAGCVLALVGRPLLGVGLGDWAYVAVLYLLGPILLVNGLLKSHWGRARPADVSDFGGAHLFTPPWQPADQCISNCSFVSGEMAATAVMAIAMLVLRPALARWFPKSALRLWGGAAYLLPVLVGAQRVATGRHFLSDVVFPLLFMLGLAILLTPLRNLSGGQRH